MGDRAEIPCESPPVSRRSAEKWALERNSVCITHERKIRVSEWRGVGVKEKKIATAPYRYKKGMQLEYEI